MRLEAARALEQMEGREAALMLRIKVQLSDRESSVTGQAVKSLLVVEGSNEYNYVELQNTLDQAFGMLRGRV